MRVLEEPITPEVVTLAIRSLQSSKAPGQEGDTAEFYKTFTVEIAPLRLRVFLPATFYLFNTPNF